MTRRGRSHGWVAVALFGCFCGGVIVGWQLRGAPVLPGAQSSSSSVQSSPSVVSGSPPAVVSGSPPAGVSGFRRTSTDVFASAPQSAIDALRHRELRVPIDGFPVESMRGGFDERRDAGGRPHEAVDLLAPRNTPVHAADDGTIAKLFVSKAGGNTIYQFDPSERFCYYYAHLDRYADTLRSGAQVSRGDVIGFVGTSGNAPRNTPHLHFAIFELTPERHWWQGTPIDPYLAFRRE